MSALKHLLPPYQKGDAPPAGKPSWDEAPHWAHSLGVAAWPCDYNGEWCWCAGTAPAGFDHVEVRPK